MATVEVIVKRAAVNLATGGKVLQLVKGSQHVEAKDLAAAKACNPKMFDGLIAEKSLIIVDGEAAEVVPDPPPEPKGKGKGKGAAKGDSKSDGK